MIAHRLRKFTGLIAALPILTFLSISAFAQQTEITGTITDQYGAGVPGAAIEITPQAPATTTKVSTDDQGTYAAAGLQPGRYQIVVSAKGFVAAKSNLFTLQAGQVLNQDVTLAVEGTQSSITVSAFTDLGLSPRLNPAIVVADRELPVLAGPGRTSSFLAANLAPGVVGDTADAYGLSFTRSLNVRGRSDFFLDRTYNGLPLGVIVGGTMDMFDMENVKDETVYAGPMLANQAFGFSTAGGVLEQTLIDPRNEQGVIFS